MSRSDFLQTEGVADVRLRTSIKIVVVFDDGTSIRMGEREAHPTCGVCEGSGLKGDGSGDACETCTYWVEGAPCQTRKQVFAEIVEWVASYRGFAEWDKGIEPEGERDRVNSAIEEFGFWRGGQD